MPILQHRARSKTNASIISIMQRFSDISVIFLGVGAVCFYYGLVFFTTVSHDVFFWF